jgi:hypothetical protein
MADNSTAETSNFSINDAASLLMDSQQEKPEEQTAAEQPADADVQPSDAEYDDFDDEAAGDETDAELDESEYDDDEEDASDEEADSDEEEQPEFHTVKVDGEEIEVTLDEALAGYQRQSAFTKRMQALSEDKKAFEAEKAETVQMRDAYAQGLHQLSETLQAQTGREPDWASLKQQLDPMEYADAVRLHNEQKESLRNVQAEQQRIANEQNAEQQYRYQAHLANESKRMLEVIPAWQDDKVRNNEREQVIAYAKKAFGYTEDEIKQASDHRAVKALYDSWKLSQINEKSGAATKRVRKAPKMAKAGAPKSKSESQSRRKRALRKRLDNDRSIDSAVDLLLG